MVCNIGYVGLLSWSNDDPRLTLTYLTSRSNLLPYALNEKYFEKLIFLKTVVALVIILT